MMTTGNAMGCAGARRRIVSRGVWIAAIGALVILGLPIGCDVCYTNHAEADADDMDTLMTLLATAGVTFLIGVPGADDVMLGYQSLSFHDALYLREVFGLRRAPEFEAWLERMELIDSRGRLLPASPRHPLLALQR